VGLRAVKALKEIAGRDNLFGESGSVDAVIGALQFPDRLVRINAAEALATALPQQGFTGQERVVPILAEAVGQTGKTNVLVILPEQDQVNAMVEALRQAGFEAAGEASVDAALAASN